MDRTSEETAPGAAHTTLRRDLSTVIVIGLAYFFAHRIAFLFPDPQEVNMLVWPAGGIGLAAFLLTPRRLWPWLTLVFFLSGITSDVLIGGRSFAAGAGFMTGNMVESIVCAVLILRWNRDFRHFTRTERELRISQRFLNNIIDCSPNALWIADERGFAIRTNQALRTSLHLRDEQALGKYNIFNDNLIEAHGFMPLVRNVFEKGVTAHFVVPYDTTAVRGITFDRPSSLVLDVHISPILDHKGKVTNAVIQHTDVSDRRRVEEELRRSEDRFRQLAENFPETIFEADLSGRVTYANPHGMEWFGVSDADIRRGVNIMDFVAPQDREAVRDRIQQRFLGKTEGFMEYKALRTGGETFDALVYSALAYHDGRVSGLSGFILDVSERKLAERSLRESEEQYRQLIETMTDGVYRSSHEGKFLEVNPAMVKILGYRTREELLAIDIKSDLYFAPGDRESAALEEKLEEMAVFRLRKKDGAEVWVEDHGRHVIDEQGNIRYHEGVLRDVTERMRAEEALRQAQKLNSIGTLAGGIAHDFNNVLGGIVGYTDMSLRYAEKGSVLERNLQKVLKVSDRARQLIQQILTFSRKASSHRSIISLRPVMEEVLELLKASIPSSVVIQSDVSRQTKPVLADPTKIHEAVLNLATNAVHAMSRKGTLTIRLCAKCLDRPVYGQCGEIGPGEYAVIEVSDTGCGMDAATLSKAFEPFFTTKGVGEGTGMGLSVVLGVVQSAGGDVMVESVKGSGTTFRLYLPVSKDAPAAAAHDNDLIPFSGTEKILFVDDERMLVETAVDLLAGLGYRVTGTSDSLEALNLLRDGGNGFDMLITDQTMPGMTGIELVREARRLRADMPVILCTGFSDDLTPEIAASIRIDSIIMKPYRYNDIAKTVRGIMDR